jgi:type IV secretory pathway TrbF-like protein
MRGLLLMATVLLAAVVALASPLGELLLGWLGPGVGPLVLGPEPRCRAGLPEDPWWRSVGGELGHWIEDARTVSPDPARAARLEAESLRIATARAEATLAAYFELRDAPRLAPPPAEVEVTVTDVRFCPGAPPVWEVAWTETRGRGSEPTRWRAALRVEEIRIPADYPPETHLDHPEGFLIIDFDWGRVPGVSRAVQPVPLTLEEQTP